jgi:hypothetical protein
MSFVRSLGVVALMLASVGSAACSADTSDDPVATPDPDSDENDIRAAATTLSIALVGREYDEPAGEWRKVQLASLNPALERAGLEKFDKAITLTRTDGKAKFDALLARLEAANTKLHRKIELQTTWDPNDYVGICYTGIVSGVMKTVEAQRGSAFPEYMGVQAYRFKNTKKIHSYSETEWFEMHAEGEDHSAELKVWKEFDTSGDKFLMMADGGQQGDGTEFFPVVITKCQ